MRWYYWPLFALIMGFALGGSFEATYFKPIQNSVTIEHNDKAQQSTNQENEKRCEERQFWPRTFCDPTANFTLWLAGLTGILAVFTVGLWFVTLGIFRDSKQSAERQQRAYVMVEGLTLSIDPAYKDRFGATVTAKNFGLTPAREVVEWAQISVRSMPNAEPFIKVDTPYPSKSVLAPGVYSIQIPTHPPISETTKIMILMSQAAIFVCGEIRYIDAFNEQRMTKYRFMCVGQGYNLGLFRQCEEGNDWT